jgi:hypothetical protein
MQRAAEFHRDLTEDHSLTRLLLCGGLCERRSCKISSSSKRRPDGTQPSSQTSRRPRTTDARRAADLRGWEQGSTSLRWLSARKNVGRVIFERF